MKKINHTFTLYILADKKHPSCRPIAENGSMLTLST